MEKYPLRREKILKKTISWVIIPLFLGIIAVVVSLFASSLFIIVISLFLVFMAVISAIAYWYENEYFRKYFYDLTEEGIVTQKGVFSTHVAIVPPNKVQDIYLDQDLLDRIFGLWDLHVSSATETSGAEAHIDGIGFESANGLRQTLMSALLPESAKKEDFALGGKLIKELRPSGAGLIRLLITNVFSVLILFIFLWGLWPIFIILVPVGLVLAYLDFTVLRYEIREEGVFLRRGFITRSENIFLYKNIQDVIETADMFDRILGIKSLSIKTMTGSSAISAVMPYLSASDAPALREEILGLMRRESQKAEKAAKAQDLRVSSAMEMAVPEKPARSMPTIEETNMPYKNEFYRMAQYSSLVVLIVFLSIAAVLSLLVIIAFGINFIILMSIFGLAIALSVIFIAGNYFSAFLSVLSLDYTISSDFVLIKTGILNIIKKQINYNKMQDLEKKIGFIGSFAGLASVKLETGSKEVVNQKNKQIASAITQNEIIPDLMQEDAEKLKQTILSQMGVSTKGIGANPLVSRLPLEAVKPIKKALWWAIYSLLIFSICACAVFVFAQDPNWHLSWLLIPLFVLLALVCAIKYIYEYYYYKKYFYDLNDEMLVIRKGVFGSRELTIPFEKIQDVFIDRDWLDLAFGLYDVYVSTVSSRSILNAHLDGLNEKNAEKAALLLLEKIR